MHPAPFDYHKPANVAEAVQLLTELGDGAKLLAGGHSLLPAMKLRLAQPGHLVDISELAEVRGVRRDGDTLVIGALTTHREIERDPLLAEACPLLVEMAGVVGDRQVRNRGTIGGALAHADAAADYPAGILALDATLVATGPEGERTIPATDFFVDLFTTALAPDEVLTEIRVPVVPARTGSSYQKLANQASGYATVGVAAVITLGEDGTCRSIRLGLTGAVPAAQRLTDVEAALTGTSLDDAAVRQATVEIGADLDLLDDLHASAEYRRRVAQGLTERAIQAAVRAAGA